MSITVIEKSSASVPTPASGKITLFADSADGVFKQKDDAGNVTQFGSTTAAAVANTPAGNISSTTVQDAINELDTEKAAVSHTHTASNITDFNTAADSRVSAGISAHEAAPDPHPGYLTETEADALYDAIGDAAAAQAFAIQRSNHTGTQLAETVTGSADGLAWFDSSGELASLNGVITYSPSNGGLSMSIAKQPNDGPGYQNLNYTSASFSPLQDSVSETSVLYGATINIDQSSSGYAIGTAGQALGFVNYNFDHQGTSDVGGLYFYQSTFTIGNGTDPIDVKGLAYSYGFGNFYDNVTLTGPLQGYGFQPTASSGVTFTSNAYTNAFYDYASVSTSVYGWNSFAAGPTLAGVQNNTNYTAFTTNPTITEFFGNSGFNGVAVTPTITTINTGTFNGVYINPTVGASTNSYGLSINMSNVTASGTKRAIDVIGDVYINGSLSFTGALSVGQLSAFYASSPVDGGGNPTTLHGLTTGVTALNGTTTANADTIGVNTAMLITMEANSTLTSGAFGLGLTALALPCVVETHTSSSLDYMGAAAYAINLVGTSTGGTIDEVNVCRSVVIPNGITTLNKVRGFYYHEPFGSPSSNSHGVYVRDSQSYMEGGLIIGGTPTSDDRLENSSVGLEINSTTLVFLPSRMTSTQRDALTPVNGMVLYNSTTDKLQVRSAGSWVDLH